jgi:hypothetical protein
VNDQGFLVFKGAPRDQARYKKGLEFAFSRYVSDAFLAGRLMF